jgi:methionyl-tRNA synthetase
MSRANPEHILVCVAWPYANADLHVGHIAGCYLPADIFARYHRLRGNAVLMVSGSDEHGTPVGVVAEKEGVGPEVVAGRFHEHNSQAMRDLDIQFDLFTRTSTENHARVAQELFLDLHGKGLLEKRTQQVPYCASCDRFLPDRFVEGTCPHCGYENARGDQCEHCGKTLDPQELLDARCKISGDPPSIRDTEHLFFKLSSFSEPLLAWLEDKRYWRPNVIHFTRNWIRDGLKDRPVTRDLTWGVPVPLPGYEQKRIYVWFEAVMGYLSASKEWAALSGDAEAWRRWWTDPAARSYYFLGKDNIPFHSIIWPSILMGVGGLNLPYDVPANEYLQLGGAKLSKSAGIGIWVRDLVERFQVDAVRYYISANMPETRDSSWSWEEFVQRVNDELVGVFGNLCHRTLTFTQRTFGAIPERGRLDAADEAALRRIEEAGAEIAAALEACEFRRGLRALMALAQSGNQYFDQKAPWKLRKTDEAACGTALHVCLQIIQALAIYAAPYMPRAAGRLWRLLGNDGPLEWSAATAPLVAGRELSEPEVLIEKLDAEAVLTAAAGEAGRA